MSAPPAVDDTPPPISDAALREWLRHLTEGQAQLVAELHRQSRLLPNQIETAVASGVTAALTHRDTVATTLGIVVEVAQERTAQHAGRWIVGWSGRMIRNAVLLLVFGWLAIKLLGWDVAAAVGKWLASSK